MTLTQLEQLTTKNCIVCDGPCRHAPKQPSGLREVQVCLWILLVVLASSAFGLWLIS